MGSADMRHEIAFVDGPEDVLVTTYGTATVDGLYAMQQDGLADERYVPGMRVLLDHTELDWRNVTTDDLRRRVEQFVQDSPRIGPASIAVVVGQPIAYGFQRMMQAFGSHRVEFEPRVFYSLAEAREWLATRPPRT